MSYCLRQAVFCNDICINFEDCNICTLTYSSIKITSSYLSLCLYMYIFNSQYHFFIMSVYLHIILKEIARILSVNIKFLYI